MTPTLPPRRIVLRAPKYVAARILADAGIPFAFVAEHTGHTVGDVPGSFLPDVAALLARRADLRPKLRHPFWRFIAECGRVLTVFGTAVDLYATPRFWHGPDGDGIRHGDTAVTEVYRPTWRRVFRQARGM